MADDDNVVRLSSFAASSARDDLLARRRRIPRDPNVPQYYFDELKRRHPLRLTFGVEGYELRYRRSAWRKLDHGYSDDPPVQRRETHAWIVHKNRKVGALELLEIDAALVYAHAFFEAMDEESAHLCSVTEALLTCWPYFGFDVAVAGNVLMIEHIWLDRRHRARGIWQPALAALMREPLEEASIVLARPFPVEYGGRVPDDEAASNVGLKRRLAAMCRVAERVLRLTPLPLPYDDDELYLWRPASRITEEPEFHDNWRDEFRSQPETDAANEP